MTSEFVMRKLIVIFLLLKLLAIVTLDKTHDLITISTSTRRLYLRIRR